MCGQPLMHDVGFVGRKIAKGQTQLALQTKRLFIRLQNPTTSNTQLRKKKLGH